jgi:hypothetical protein
MTGTPAPVYALLLSSVNDSKHSQILLEESFYTWKLIQTCVWIWLHRIKMGFPSTTINNKWMRENNGKTGINRINIIRLCDAVIVLIIQLIKQISLKQLLIESTIIKSPG